MNTFDGKGGLNVLAEEIEKGSYAARRRRERTLTSFMSCAYPEELSSSLDAARTVLPNRKMLRAAKSHKDSQPRCQAGCDSLCSGSRNANVVDNLDGLQRYHDGICAVRRSVVHMFRATR